MGGTIKRYDNGTTTGLWVGKCGACGYGVLSASERHGRLALVVHEWKEHDGDDDVPNAS